MEAAVKKQVRKIMSDAIKLNYNVEYLYTVEDFKELYSNELAKISELSCDLQHRLKPLLGYVEVDDMEERFKASGEIKEYWKTPQ